MLRKLTILTMVLALGLIAVGSASAGATTANGWYEGQEIYYILGGFEEAIPEQAYNQLYLIGGDRAFQANVAEFIPGEAGYTPHWFVNVVHTAEGVTLGDIYQAIKNLECKIGTGHFAVISEPDRVEEPPDIAATLNSLGL